MLSSSNAWVPHIQPPWRILDAPCPQYDLDCAVKAGEDRLKEHRNQIVRSPERVRREIKDLGEAAQRQKAGFAEREDAARAFHAKIEHLKVLETVASLSLSLLGPIRSV